MAINLIWGPFLACSTQTWGHSKFIIIIIIIIYYYWILLLLIVEIFLTYYLSQFKPKLDLTKCQKKTNFGSNFHSFAPNLGPKIFFSWFFPLQVLSLKSYQLRQFKSELMKQTWENSKRTNFGSNFGSFGPNLSPKSFFLKFFLC